MAIRTVITRGYGNGTFNGTIALVSLRGYISSTVVPPSPEGNIIFGQRYNMIYPPVEDPLRPTSLTEFTIRKRDKKPIITGGDH
jgi:hypothetical protein